MTVQDTTYTEQEAKKGVCKARCDISFFLFLRFIFNCSYFCAEGTVESKYARSVGALQAPLRQERVYGCATKFLWLTAWMGRKYILSHMHRCII